jgi:FAD/FMN-containing dehydrogenase
MVNQWTGWSCLPIDLDAEDQTERNSQDESTQPTEAQIPIPGSDEDQVKLELRSEHGRTCSDRGYPAYVVNATTVQHIQAAITFVRTHNIRLTIKNTGHDLPGRSTAPGSLSIWTHHLNSAEYHPGPFSLSGSNKQIEGDFIIAGSGCQNGKIQDLAHKHGRVFTGGGSRNVGIGGFVTGGGHSMLSPHYGLAADNVVQMEVVIPSGEALTVNEDQHADLFWALRGVSPLATQSWQMLVGTSVCVSDLLRVVAQHSA